MQLARTWTVAGSTLLLAAAVLWQVAGCVVPPDEQFESPNLPPWIDWSLTVPAEDQFVFDLSNKLVEEFSIEQAAEDPEGDSVYAFWYYRVWRLIEDTDKYEKGKSYKLFAGFGELSYDFPTCTHSPAPGSRIQVVVAVSDVKLKWVGSVDEDNPVEPGEDEDGEARPMVKRVWWMDLDGVCP